jgi:hypothetical protein
LCLKKRYSKRNYLSLLCPFVFQKNATPKESTFCFFVSLSLCVSKNATPKENTLVSLSLCVSKNN